METTQATSSTFSPRLARARRDENVVFRLNQLELSVLDRYATAAGVSRADFIRSAIGASIAAAPAA